MANELEKWSVMVRINILLVLLLAALTNLVGCGSNQNPANLDTADAVVLQRGQITAAPQRVLRAEYNDQQQKVIHVEQKELFDVNESRVDINWDTKEVIFVTEVSPKFQTGKKKGEKIQLEGRFNSDGIAYLKPVNEAGRSVGAFAGVRCKDNKCEEITIDVGADFEVDGKKQFEQEQLDVKNPSPLEFEMPKATAAVDKTGAKEITPEGQNLKAKGTKGAKTQTKPKADFSKVTGGVSSNAKVLTQSKDNSTEDSSNEEVDLESSVEPGVPTILPSVIKPEMRSSQQDEIRLNDYSESNVFPYDLGENYLGKALGPYDRTGTLVKGIDVARAETTAEQTLHGFKSIRRGNKVYYGSGLLVKMIEEAGKRYAQLVPDGHFEVNDLSKKGGGRVRPHVSHRNGLDADIRLVRKSNGSIDYAKTWKVIKSFVDLGYVDVIFLNQRRINELCNYLKKNEKDYSDTFKYLYRESGHTTHMHVRVKCTNHNVGCRPSAYDKRKYGVCS